MITIIGVGHVFDIQDRVRDEIKMRRPTIVAVELDRNRYEALKSGENGGQGSLIYRAVAFIQKKIAREYGVQVGGEMLAAVEAAEDINANVALIDLPSQYVFKKLMDSMSLKEKIYFILGTVAGLFAGRKRIEKEMKRYQENEDQYMEMMEESVPSISRILIDERNKHMAENLNKLDEEWGSVVAVVGDGHVRGLLEELGREEVEVVRLKEIQSRDLKDKDTNTEVEFSYTYNFN